MKNINNLKKIIKDHKSELVKSYKIAKIGLFGSYVRGEQKKGSDIDVLVEFYKPVSLFKFIDLEERLKNLFSAEVDLVSTKALKPHIGKYILKEVQYI